MYPFSDKIRLLAEIIIFYWRPRPFFLRFSCSLYSYNLKNKFSNQRRKINLVNEPNCWVGGVRRTTQRTVVKLTKYCRRELLLCYCFTFIVRSMKMKRSRLPRTTLSSRVPVKQIKERRLIDGYNTTMFSRSIQFFISSIDKKHF